MGARIGCAAMVLGAALYSCHGGWLNRPREFRAHGAPRHSRGGCWKRESWHEGSTSQRPKARVRVKPSSWQAGPMWQNCARGGRDFGPRGGWGRVGQNGSHGPGRLFFFFFYLFPFSDFIFLFILLLNSNISLNLVMSSYLELITQFQTLV
jgi:hypothetical protein